MASTYDLFYLLLVGDIDPNGGLEFGKKREQITTQAPD